MLFTAGLHPQGERGAPGDPGLERRTARPFTLAEPHAGWQLAVALEQPNQIELLVVPDDAKDAWKRRDVLLTACRVTTGDDDSGGGVLTGDATNRLTRALVGRGGDRAGVDDDQIRGARRRALATPPAQIFLEAERVRLIHPAAEVMTEYFTPVQLRRGLLDLLRQLLLVGHEPAGESWIADGEDLRRQHAGVGRAPASRLTPWPPARPAASARSTAARPCP